MITLSTHPFFKMHKQEFHEERHVIAGMKAMPYGQKQESRDVTYVSIVKKFEPFVDILEYPQVGLHVKRGNIVTKAVCVLEDTQLNVGTTTPIFDASALILRYERKT